MAKSILYTCDVCGTTKEVSNHWLYALECREGLSFYPWNAHEVSYEQPGVIHLCGAGCATKTLSKQIHDWTQPAVESLI